MATAGVAAEVSSEKLVQEETGELLDRQCPPLKLEKELSGNLVDNVTIESEVKMAALLNGAMIGDVDGMNDEVSFRKANQSMSEDSPGDNKHIKSTYLGNLGCSEGEDFTKLPSNIQVSLDAKIEGKRSDLDKEISLKMGKEMVESDTSCNTNSIGEIEKKDENEEREHSSEANEKGTCNANPVQKSGEWSLEDEKEAKVHFEEALEPACKQEMKNNVEEDPLLAVKDLNCLNLKEEVKEIAISNYTVEIGVNNKTEVLDFDKEASETYIDRKCVNLVGEYSLATDRLEKDEQKKVEEYSYTESDEIGHAVLETNKNGQDKSQKDEAEVHTYICKSPTPRDCPNAPLKESSCSNETDKAPAVEQEMNLNILAHDVMVLKQKFGDGGLQDGGRQEMDTVSDVNKKDDELEDTQEKQSSEDILHSVASHVTNLQNADKKIKDTEEEIIQMDDGIQEADIGEEGKANGFKLKTVLRENEGTSITKVDTGDGKVEDGLNLASEAKQPETIEANEKILLNNNAGEEIQNTQSFEGQKVEVKEPCETVDKNILEPTTINNSEEKPVRDKSTDDIQDENLQCDVIRDGLQETSQRTEEKQPVTLLQTEVEHRRDQDDSSTVYTEVDGSEVENQRKQRSLNGEMHVQGISKKDKELNGETEKSQDTDLHQDNNLDDGDIVKSTDTGRIKENTSTEKFETAEPLEQLFNTNKGTITLGHDVQNEQTTDAIDLDTSSSEQTTEEKFLMSNQENWKDEAVPNQINKKDNSNKENDSDVVDSKTDECKNMQGTDFQFKQKLNQAGADCEPYDAQQDVGLISIASSTGEVSGFPKSNIEQSRSTEDHKEASLIACGLEDENGKKHDSYPETLPLGGNPAEKHVQAEPICSKQEEEIRSNKNIDVADGLADCQERIKIWDLDEQTKSALKTNEMIEQESNETSALVRKEDKTQESNPDKNNALLSVTQESVEKTLEKEHDILQKEVTWSDTQEAIHEISSMTIETMCENNEKSYAESQPTSQRIEVYESMSYSPGKEQYEPEIDQEASSTVIKDVGKNHKTTDEVAENKVYPDINIYAQDIPEDGKDDTMQEISLPPDHLTFNEDIMILKDNEVLKVKSDRKFQPLSSLQHTEDKCHLNTQLKNGNIAPASEITEQDDESHKVVNLCDKNSHDEKSNILSMSDAQADNRHSQTDTQEYSKLINTESSEVAKINQGALETNPEQSETKERIDDGNSNVNIIKVETDEQKLDHEQEPLSHVGDAAGGGINTERKHVYKDPKCSEELGLTSQEREEGRGGKLEEEAGFKKLEKQESYKHDDSRKEIENVRTTDNTEISEQENKRTYDLEVKNEECTDGSNTHQGIPDELVEENIKQTLNHQEDDFREEINDAEDTQEGTISGEKRTEDPTEINGEHMGNANAIENADRKTVSSQTSEQDNLSEKTKGALTEKTEMITISGKEEQKKISHSNVDDELVEETHDQTPNDTGLMSEDTMDAAKKEMKVTIDSEKEHSEEEELNVDTMVATTEETNIPTVLEQEDKETCDIKEINKELTIKTKASFNITRTLVEEAGKQTPNNEESSKQHDLSEDTNPINATTEETNEQIILEQEDRETDDIKETDEDHKGESKASFKITDRLVEESSKQDNKSGNTTNATTEETNMPTVPKHEDRGADEIKKTNEEFDDETKSSFNINHELVEEAGKQTSNYQEDSEPDDLREDTLKTTIENVDMPIIQGQDDRGTNDTKGTNEGCEDESKLIEEISKQTLDNQESSKQDDLNGNTTNATTEETNEPIVLIQEDRATENLKEKNEEIKIESVAFINISDEMVKEAGTQTSDNQGSYKQDDVSRDTTNATTEETNVHTILKQEDRATDDLKDINKGHKDESKASFSIIDELVDNTGKQASDSQESSKQDDLSGDTSPATAEQTNNPTVPEQKDRGTEDIKDTNEECKDESKASFNITEKSDEERTKPDDPRGDTTKGTIEEISIPIIQQQEDREIYDTKEINEGHNDESNGSFNIINGLIEEASKQPLNNQGSSKPYDSSKDTTKGSTEDNTTSILLVQEERVTDHLKETNKELTDESKASFNIADELVEDSSKQTPDNQESSKQDELSGHTTIATMEETNKAIVLKQEDNRIDDVKETSEEHKGESKASFSITDELVGEAGKQTPKNQEISKPDDLRVDITNATIKHTSMPVVPRKEDRGTEDSKETNEEHKDESKASFNSTDELVEEAVKQMLDSQESSKPEDLRLDTINATIEETNMPIVQEQDMWDRGINDIKETDEECKDKMKASFNITDELVEEAGKQSHHNQESSEPYDSSKDTTNANTEETKMPIVPMQESLNDSSDTTNTSTEDINMPIVPMQEDMATDDHMKTNKELTDESKVSFITNEMIEEARKQMLDSQESSKQDDLSGSTTNASKEKTYVPITPEKKNSEADDIKEANEECKDESKDPFNRTDELVEGADKQTCENQEDRGIDDIKDTKEENKDESKSSFDITDKLVEEAGKHMPNNQEGSKPEDLREDTIDATIEETSMPIILGQEDRGTDDTKEINEECKDESKASLSITDELDEEAGKQMPNNQESCKLYDSNKDITYESTEEDNVPIIPKKEDKEISGLQEPKEELTDESKAYFSITDELVVEAGKQTLDIQEISKPDVPGEERENALAEDSKDKTVPEQEINRTRNETIEEHIDEDNLNDKSIDEAVGRTLDNQESSKQDAMNGETKSDLTEETKEVTVSDMEVDPNPASNSLSEDKESKEETDDVPSMDNRLPVDTEEAAEQVLSEGMAEDLATKEKSVSPASDVPGSADTSHEAKDVEMASANLLAAAVVANAEEGSNSAFITSIPDTAGPENHGEEHKTQEFDHFFTVKTEQNANSDEDNESKGRFLENFDATVGSNQEMETKACQDEGQNKPSTQELPLDGATAAEMNKLSHDSPSNVPKDEGTESNFPQEESITTIAMDEGEAVLDEEGDKQKMSSVMSVLDNEATVGDATLRRAEEFEDKAVLSTEIDLTNSKDETTFQEVHVLAVSEVPNAMACAKDATGIFQEIKAEERSEIQTCKEASVAEKSPTEEGKERKITEVETHDQANSGTPESDTDKEMAVDYLPVSQYLIDRIMREEDAKRETVVQEGIEDGQEVVDSMGKGLEISTDTQERTEELVLDETDAEPNSKANSLPAMLTSVEDAKMEVFLYDMIDIIPHKDGICELTGKAETRSESESEQTDLGTGTHGQSDSTPEVMQLKTTLDNNGALAKDPESPSVAEPVNNEILREEKNKRYEESIEENPSDELLEEVITKEHSRETTVTPEIKNFTRNIENHLETQEPSRTVIAVNQVEDCLEFAADINEIDVTSKLSGIPETQIEGSAGRTKLLDLDETHSLGSRKDATGHDNQIAESMLKEKSFAINGNELDKEEIDTPAGTDETKDIFGVDESPLKTQEPSTFVPQENQLVQDAVEFFAPAEKERKSQMGDVNNKIDDLKAHSALEEQNEREILLGEKHPPELEKKSKDDNTWVIDDTHDEKNTAISVGEAGEEPVDVQVHEDVTCEEVEKDADENEFDKLDTDATMMENKEEEPKTEHKKSHNLLSGVRSKVKHSISKVKKAITGKSSHSKTTPAK